MKKDDEFFVIFNTKDFGVEVVTIIDSLNHKLIVTKKEILEIVTPLLASKPLSEAIASFTLWLVRKIDNSVNQRSNPMSERVVLFLSKINNLNLSTRARNGLHRGQINYVWELAFFAPGNFKDLIKLHQFGKRALAELEGELKTKFGKDYLATFKSLQAFLSGILAKKCDEVAVVKLSQEYQYLEKTLRPEYLAELSLLANFHAYREYFPNENDYLVPANYAQESRLFYISRNSLREIIHEYLAQVIRERYV